MIAIRETPGCGSVAAAHVRAHVRDDRVILAPDHDAAARAARRARARAAAR